MHKIWQRKDSMKVRIELQIFIQQSVKFCLQEITTLYKLLIYQKTLKRHLKEQFQQLKDEKRKRSQIVLDNKRKIMKPAVLNLTGKNIDKNNAFLLNLGPNFVPIPKPIPYEEIITAIE